MTILDSIKKIKEGKLTITDLVNSCIKNIEEKDGEINAFITFDKEAAIKKAIEADKELKEYMEKGNVDELYSKKPLFGIPVAHKDIFSTKDFKSTSGSKILDNYYPPYDATIVRKLKDAGAITLGKLNCDAFAHGASGENSDYGPTKNPYDLSRVPGGSSSGTAASVASDMTLFSTGTDTGGSLRNPASFTNTVAIKPTYGRVSRYGITSMASSLDSIGYITNTVSDAAYIYGLTCGKDDNDASSSDMPVDDYFSYIKENLSDKNKTDKPLDGLKVGIPTEYFVEGLDPEISESVENVKKKLVELGATLTDVSLPHTSAGLAVYYILMPSEVTSNLGRLDGIRYGKDRTEFGAEAKRRIMIGSYVLSSGYYDAYYLKAQKVRTLVIEDFKQAFEKVDVLLAPVTPMLPPKLGENTSDPLKMYLMDVLTTPINLAGLPALAIPSGFSKKTKDRNELPIGVQLIGPQFDEKNLFRIGLELECAIGLNNGLEVNDE